MKEIEIFGESKHIEAWLRDPRCRVSRQAFLNRRKRGLSPLEALTNEPITGAPRKNFPAFYGGPVRAGDMVDRTASAGRKGGTTPCLFVWDVQGGILELRSYGNVKQDPDKPIIERVNIHDFRSRYSVRESNTAGRLLLVDLNSLTLKRLCRL